MWQVRLGQSMSLLAGICLVLIAQPAPAAPLDRSGEPALTEAITYFGKLNSAHLCVNRYLAEVKGGPLARESWYDLYWGGTGRYRYSYSDNWSEGLVVTSDGTTIMADDLTPSSAIVLRKWVPGFHNVPNLAPTARGSVLISLFDGPPALLELTSKDKPLIVKVRGEVYEWTLYRPEGTGTLTLKKTSEGWIPIGYRYEKPETGGRPWDSEVTLDEVAAFTPNMKVSKGTFEVNPPSTARVNDLRKGPAILPDVAP